MKPYYHDEQYGITIYHADCHDILPHLEPVDLVLTDPPYGIGIDRAFNDDFLQIQKLNELSYYPLKLIVFTSPRRIADIIEYLEFEFCRALWWYKPNDIAHSWHGFQMVSETILVFKRGDVKYPKQEQSYHDVLSICNEKQKFHPCCKPIKVISPLIRNFSFVTDTILDPFMGSGTTLVAAKQLGRKAIGIEIEQKYCDIAIERLRQGVLEL